MNDYAYSTHKEQLCGNGYDVLPVKGKIPITKNWQKHNFCNDPTPKRRSKRNLGIKTGEVIGIDLDILDEDTVSQLITLAADKLGDAPVRVGKAPKALLAYRTEMPFKKILLRAAKEGEQIEVLGQGQQFVALGVHPDTGTEYVWDEDLLSIQRDDLTLVTEAQVREYLTAAAELLGVDGEAEGGGEVSDSTGTTLFLPDDDPFLDALDLKEVEPGKYNGDCPAGEEHTGGRMDGFVYWQDGYHGQVGANAHCSHASHADWTLADFEKLVGAKAGGKDSMATLGALLRDRPDMGTVPTAVSRIRNPYPQSMSEVPDYVKPSILPHPEMAGPQDARYPSARQPCKLENVQAVLDKIGAEVRYNELSKFEEVTLPWTRSASGFGLNDTYNQLFAACQSAGMNAKSIIVGHIDTIALQHSYHPFRDYLQGLTWDGTSHVHALGTALRLVDEGEREMLDIYVRRFLIQIVEGICRAVPGQLRGLLLLCGSQGIGKTHWLSRLVGPEYFKDGVSVASGNTAERDFLMASTRHVLVELGELDATFRKADISHLKALLTRAQDCFRAPYAAKDVAHVRRVAYCGSVNDISVLVDETGNTRFWPIEIKSIKWDSNPDMDQVWAEAVHLWKSGEPWQLTPTEEALRGQHEHKYRALSMAEEKVQEYFDELTMATDKGGWVGRTCTELCEQFGLKIDRKTLNEMGHALKRLTHRNHSGDSAIDGKRRAWLLPPERVTKLGKLHLVKKTPPTEG